MTTYPLNNTAESRLPYRLATVLVCAVFPLIWVGGLVTSSDAGMAVPDWPNTYGYNLFLYPWQTWFFGPWDIFVEHGHRLLAAGIGMLTIALAIVVRRYDARPWVVRLAYFAVPLVILQGVLGGLRVVLDKQTLAMLHACVGPLFFAYCVALRHYLTPRAIDFASAEPTTNRDPDPLAIRSLSRLSRLAIVTTLLAYVQLVLGALVRHSPHMATFVTPSFFRAAVLFHLFMAAVLTVHIVQLAIRSYSAAAKFGAVGLRGPASWLTGSIVVQLLLGAATWVVNYGFPEWAAQSSIVPEFVVRTQSFAQLVITTAHVAVGSLILAISTALSLRAHDAVARRLSASPAAVARAASNIRTSLALLSGGLLMREGAL
ncbi:MAG: COX15/CtaA family protein [Planctomycetia bacterium]|nr:COX15/CtaA family protein [Planctomycetia bacterium]